MFLFFRSSAITTQSTLHSVLFIALISLLSILYFPQLAQAAVIPDDPGNFITTWNTENPGTSNDDQITIFGSGIGFSYEIYWEDTASSTINGTTTLITSSSYTLTFPSPGIYEVQASGTIPKLCFFRCDGDEDKLLTVEQWGVNKWQDLVQAFESANNLRVLDTDAPDLSNVTSLFFLFKDADLFNDPVNHWDVSTIEDMRSTFAGTNFNQPLNNWEVGNVTNMERIFEETPFNQDISNWDVSNVDRFFFMFRNSDFNQPVNNWDVSSSTNFLGMFRDSSFNQPLDQWEVSSDASLSVMFKDNPAFNQPINSWEFSGSLRQTFQGATAFNQPLDQWTVAKGTNFNSTFDGATAFDQDLSSWQIASATVMTNFLRGTALSQANQDATLSSFATQAVDNDIQNIPLHIGVKSYSSIGANAITTLQGLGWTIDEQYQATYSPGQNATLIGTGTQSPLDRGATTTSVEIKPDSRCTFQSWSDGSKDNPRNDVLTDNLSVEALVSCASRSGGTSARARANNLEAQGKTDEAKELRDRFNITTSTQSTDATTTIEDTIAIVQTFIDRNDDKPVDRTTVIKLLTLLLALVETLTSLLLEVEGS